MTEDWNKDELAKGQRSEIYDGEHISHCSATELLHNHDAQQTSSELSCQSKQDPYPPVAHVDATHPHPPVDGSFPGYQSLHAQQSNLDEIELSSHQSQMFELACGIPRAISIGSSTDQSFGYGGEGGRQHDFLGHSYHSAGACHSLYPSSYEVASPSSGFNRHYNAINGDMGRRRSDPNRCLSRSKSYEPTPHDYRNRERSSRRPDTKDTRVGKPNHVRGVARSRSYEPSPYDHLSPARRSSRRPDVTGHSPDQPDFLRCASRSKSYEPVPYNQDSHGNERDSRRPDIRDGLQRELGPVRGVPRSISYDTGPNDHLNCSTRGNERSSRRPQRNPIDEPHPRRHVPRSISLQSSHSGDRSLLENGGSQHKLGYSSRNPDPCGKGLAYSHHSSDECYRFERGREEKAGSTSSRDSFLRDRHSSKWSNHQRQSELSGSTHSISAGTSSSLEEFATENVGTKEKQNRPIKRGSKKDKESKSNSEKTKEESVQESVKDGELDAYKAMINVSDRVRKKKPGATSYVTVPLGNGVTGYVKSV